MVEAIAEQGITSPEDDELRIYVTFGTVPHKSIAYLLCPEEDRNDLVYGNGRFSKLRERREFDNTEMYQYLRLGMCHQSASALKLMGYETPESLLESAETKAMLPDTLVSEHRAYPMDFIDQCEQAGISAVSCQRTLIKGITERHINKALNAKQLVEIFSVIVGKKNKVARDRTTNSEASLFIDYFCEGILPYELIEDGGRFFHVNPQRSRLVVRELVENPEYTEFWAELRSSCENLKKFIIKSPGTSEVQVARLKNLIDAHGYEVLDMRNPALCYASDHAESLSPIGYEVAKYIEAVYEDSGYQAKDSNRKIYSHDYGVTMTIRDLHRLCLAGVDPELVRDAILIKREADADFLIEAKEANIPVAVMGGFL